MRTRYRTWFYASFVCAYACYPSGHTSSLAPGSAPSGGRAGSRRAAGRSRCACRSCRRRLPLAVAPGCRRGVDSPRRSAARTSCGPTSDSHSFGGRGRASEGEHRGTLRVSRQEAADAPPGAQVAALVSVATASPVPFPLAAGRRGRGTPPTVPAGPVPLLVAAPTGPLRGWVPP